MKSYTDIDQSRKLAEILPLESADMSWVSNGLGKPFARTIPIKGDPEELFACWSLAALLSVLPSVIKRKRKRMFLTLEKAGAYNLYYKSPDRLDELWETDFESIDVCYKMILLLHKLKNEL